MSQIAAVPPQTRISAARASVETNELFVRWQRRHDEHARDVPRLQSEIELCESEPAGILVLDLEDVQFIDSAGLRVILAAHQRASDRGGRLALTPGSEQVKRLLSIAGVGDRLQMIASPDALLV
jgi:anti-sigma B factor antagonist